jgi:ubiquitin-protein ligase
MAQHAPTYGGKASLKLLRLLLFCCAICFALSASSSASSPSSSPFRNSNYATPLDDHIGYNTTTVLSEKNQKAKLTLNNNLSDIRTKTKKKKSSKNRRQKQTSGTIPSARRSDTVRRIQREWKDMVQSGMAYNWKTQKPIKFSSRQLVWVGPLDASLYVWHFTFVGVADSAYHHGVYHGRLVLPSNYPASPPRVQVWTPSGRFVTRRDVCITASNYHPELWTPTWTIRTICEALRLHFVTQSLEIGGMNGSYEQRLAYAIASRTYTERVGSVVVDHAKMIQQNLFIGMEDYEQRTEYTEPSIDGSLLQTKLPVDAKMDQVDQAETACEVIEQNAQARNDLLDSVVDQNKKRPKGNKPRKLKRTKAISNKTNSRAREKLLTRQHPADSILMTVGEIIRSPLRVALLGFLFLFLMLNR